MLSTHPQKLSPNLKMFQNCQSNPLYSKACHKWIFLSWFYTLSKMLPPRASTFHTLHLQVAQIWHTPDGPHIRTLLIFGFTRPTIFYGLDWSLGGGNVNLDRYHRIRSERSVSLKVTILWKFLTRLMTWSSVRCYCPHRLPKYKVCIMQLDQPHPLCTAID